MTGAVFTDLTQAVPATLQETLAEAVELHRLSPANDAFGRSRISQPTTLFASSFEYDNSPLVWQSVLTGGGQVITADLGRNEYLYARAVTGTSNVRVMRHGVNA